MKYVCVILNKSNWEGSVLQASVIIYVHPKVRPKGTTMHIKLSRFPFVHYLRLSMA